MAKRIKFALEMKDGMQVRNLDDLREHFDLDKTIGYFVDGKLLKWLEDRYYDEEAEAISTLSKDDSDFNSKICKILGVEYEDEDLPEIDPEEIERRNERIAKLKQYTADTKILDKVDLVAFDQEELADLLDEEEPVIYLCQNKFTIPLREKNKKYIGIGKVEVTIRSKTKVDFDELNIQFENVQFNAEYEKLIKKSPNEFLQQGEQAEEANNYDKALEFYKKATDMGSVEAMYRIAKVYDNENFNKNDIQKALEWCTKSANAGNVTAMFELGEYFLFNNKDYDVAIKWLQKSSEKNYVKSFLLLGYCYDNGTGVNEDKEKAIYWYKRSANEGNDTTAMNILGVLYETNEDYTQAVKWYKKSAENDDVDGMFDLGRAYDFGKGVEQDKRKAFEFYKKAAEKGHNQAMGYLAYAYKNGEGTKQNYRQAFYWYVEATKNDENDFAMKEVADMYREGEGVEKSDVTAFSWYRKAADKGNTEAMLWLGVYYETGGSDIEQDANKALYWYKRAATEGNDAVAMYSAASLYEGYENYSAAIEWYKKALDNYEDDDYEEAMLGLGRSYRSMSNYSEALKWLQKAANIGNAEAMNMLGLMYDNGEGVTKNETTALNWYQRAANAKMPIAMYNMAFVYERQQNYFSAIEWYKKALQYINDDEDFNFRLAYCYRQIKDYINAFKYMETAANLGQVDAMNMLGLMYSNGEGVEKNSELAIYWYEQAANEGLAVAMYNLGYEYRYILKDYQQAFYWYQQAANTGYISAMTELGDLYYNGLGVAVNKQKALELYKEAADNGDENAIKTLEKIKTVSSATKSDGCFITTAVCDSFHKPDNCYELTMFRAFRDNWLKKQTDGQQLIAQYYAIAPKIVKNIDKLADADEIYLHIWNKYLKSCLSYIEHGKNEQCKSVYVKMVQDLYKKYLN